MMPNAQTSDRVSSLAARYVNLEPDTLLALTATPASRESTAADIRTLAASLLRQDEHRGVRGLLKKVIGR
jgi:hypothetical protein